MSILKWLIYTWFKVFGVSSPEDIAAERAARNTKWHQEALAEQAAAEAAAAAKNSTQAEKG